MTTAVGDRVRLLVGGLGELLMTGGVVVLLFCAYELWFTGIYTHQQQDRLHHDLAAGWASPAPTTGPSPVVGSPSAAPSPAASSPPAAPAEPDLGGGFAVLRIPRFGQGYDPVVVEGVGREDLKKGPGHYPGTALPGQVGNFAVAGHRTTYLHPFEQLDELRPGDPIVVETRTDWYTYRVTARSVVDPSDIGVVAPVPDHPGVAPTERLLTFTTCNPRYSARTRLIVHAALAEDLPKSAGTTPAALGV